MISPTMDRLCSSLKPKYKGLLRQTPVKVNLTFKFWIPKRNDRFNPRIWPTEVQHRPFQATTVITYVNECFTN